MHDDHIYVAIEHLLGCGLSFGLPQLPRGKRWHVAINTDASAPEDIWEPGNEPLLGDQENILVGESLGHRLGGSLNSKENVAMAFEATLEMGNNGDRQDYAGGGTGRERRPEFP